MSLADEQSAQSWKLRAAVSLAHLWERQGRIDDAHGMLAPVYGWFSEGFESGDLKAARALLDSLQAP